MKNFVKIEMDAQAQDMETIVRVRQDLRMANAFASDATIAPDRAFKLACAAMLVLGEKDELHPHRNSDGEWVTVGPYVSDAVRYILKRDVPAWTFVDYQRTLQHAMLINAAGRGC